VPQTIDTAVKIPPTTNPTLDLAPQESFVGSLHLTVGGGGGVASVGARFVGRRGRARLARARESPFPLALSPKFKKECFSSQISSSTSAPQTRSGGKRELEEAGLGGDEGGARGSLPSCASVSTSSTTWCMVGPVLGEGVHERELVGADAESRKTACFRRRGSDLLHQATNLCFETSPPSTFSSSKSRAASPSLAGKP
jgi:hypothetical protein